jgi:hypothetical protein
MRDGNEARSRLSNAAENSMDIKSPSFPAGFDQKNASESHPRGKPIGSERARSFAGAKPYLYLTDGGGVKQELEGNSREAKAQAAGFAI